MCGPREHPAATGARGQVQPSGSSAERLEPREELTVANTLPTDDWPGDDSPRLQDGPWANPEPLMGCWWQGGGQDHTSPLDGLVLSEELSQSLSPCGLKVIALGQEEAGW